MPKEKSELSKLLLHVIDMYERGGDDYDALCIAVEQQDQPSDDDAQRRLSEREAIDLKLKSIFDSSRSTDAEFAELVINNPNVSRGLSLEEIRGALDQIRIHEVRGADLERVEVQSQEQLSSAQPTDLGLFFAKDFVSNLDQYVSRSEEFDQVEYSENLSPNQKLLFRQAHRCYLFGFEAATVIMCGAILEQTLKDVLRLDLNLRELLKEAEVCGLLAPEEWGMGDDVRELRNEALHNLSKFLKRPEHQRATILSNTRAVVGILLSGNSETGEA